MHNLVNDTEMSYGLNLEPVNLKLKYIWNWYDIIAISMQIKGSFAQN